MYASRSDFTLLSCVWRSSDNGVNWTNIGLGNGITTSGRTLLGVSPANPAVLYVLQSKGDLFGVLYRSNDSGKTYKVQVKASSSTNYFGNATDGSGTTGQAWYDMAICVNPKDVDEVHIGGMIALNRPTVVLASQLKVDIGTRIQLVIFTRIFMHLNM